MILGLCLKQLCQGNHTLIWRSSPLKSLFLKMISVHTKHKAVLKFLRSEERFVKFRFGDGLVWTVGLTVEKKPAFPNSSGVVSCTKPSYFTSSNNITIMHLTVELYKHNGAYQCMISIQFLLCNPALSSAIIQ